MLFDDVPKKRLLTERGGGPKFSKNWLGIAPSPLNAEHDVSIQWYVAKGGPLSGMPFSQRSIDNITIDTFKNVKH